MARKRISQEDAEEKALERLMSMGLGLRWSVFYRNEGRVNWVFKFRGGFPPEEYLVWVNGTDGHISKCVQLK